MVLANVDIRACCYCNQTALGLTAEVHDIRPKAINRFANHFQYSYLYALLEIVRKTEIEQGKGCKVY